MSKVCESDVIYPILMNILLIIKIEDKKFKHLLLDPESSLIIRFKSCNSYNIWILES